MIYCAVLLLQCTMITGHDEIIEYYQKHSVDRWRKIYTPYLPSKVLSFYEEECGEQAFMNALVDYPAPGLRRVNHYQGSPIERSTNGTEIAERVGALIEKYTDKLLAFKVLEGWASPEFYEVLEEFGYYEEELSTIMAVRSAEELQRPSNMTLPEGFIMEKINNMEDLYAFANEHGSSGQFVLQQLPNTIIKDKHATFWHVKHIPTGACCCTALIETIDRVAGVHMVETSRQFRRRGFASMLMYTAAMETFRTHSDLKCMLLGSTPEAVSLYTRLGFKKYGSYHSYDHLSTCRHDFFIN